MIINKVFDKLNKIGFNNLIFMTPHLYSFGDYAEHLSLGLKKARFSKTIYRKRFFLYCQQKNLQKNKFKTWWKNINLCNEKLVII